MAFPSIYNPDKTNEFKNLLKILINDKNPDEVKIDLNELIKYFSDKDAIFIAHDCRKAQCFNGEMIEILKNGINEKYRVFSEPSSLKSLSIMLDNGIQAMLGSDIKDWNKYPNCELPELKLEIDIILKIY